MIGSGLRAVQCGTRVGSARSLWIWAGGTGGSANRAVNQDQEYICTVPRLPTYNSSHQILPFIFISVTQQFFLIKLGYLNPPENHITYETNYNLTSDGGSSPEQSNATHLLISRSTKDLHTSSITSLANFAGTHAAGRSVTCVRKAREGPEPRQRPAACKTPR